MYVPGEHVCLFLQLGLFASFWNLPESRKYRRVEKKRKLLYPQALQNRKRWLTRGTITAAFVRRCRALGGNVRASAAALLVYTATLVGLCLILA